MVGPQIAVPDHLASLCACVYVYVGRNIMIIKLLYDYNHFFQNLKPLAFEDSHSITEADGGMSVVAVADSTQLSDEAECSDAFSDQLDEEAQPGSGCGELPSGFDVQAILVVSIYLEVH